MQNYRAKQVYTEGTRKKPGDRYRVDRERPENKTERRTRKGNKP
jgi:hypothetical protein